MRVLLQRVKEASVAVDDRITASIGPGMLLLVGFTGGDGEAEVQWMADKIVGLRVFSDDEGKMNRSVVDTGGGILVVSQFTLYGDTRRGRRPSFVDAAAPDVAEPLYEQFVEALTARLQSRIPTGVFGALMRVSLVNDGPVTLMLEREAGP